MLSKLINPSFPKAALGLEQGSITALSLQRSGRNSYSLAQAATLKVPDILLRPSFSESNILDIDEMLVSLNEAVNEAGLRRQKKWSVSLPGNTARAAILTLDNKPTSRQETDQILNWKAERIFGSAIDEMRVSLDPLAPDSDGKARYFATAIKLSVLDEYESLFEAMGWYAGLILPRHVSESKWLLNGDKSGGDSLLISSQPEGFGAVLFRKAQPAVVRSVTCGESEVDDEIFRLLMFYKDRFGMSGADGLLERILVVGKKIDPSRLRGIANEALGKALQILGPEEIGLQLPPGGLHFDQVAAPAGLATLSWG